MTEGQSQARQPQEEDDDEPPRRKKKSNKTVRWAAPEQLEQVKYFKMNDEPNKAGLSIAEVQEI